MFNHITEAKQVEEFEALATYVKGGLKFATKDAYERIQMVLDAWILDH